MKNKIIRKVGLLGDTLSATLLNQLEWLSSRLYTHANTHRPALPVKNGAVMVTGATARLLSETASSTSRHKLPAGLQNPQPQNSLTRRLMRQQA